MLSSHSIISIKQTPEQKKLSTAQKQFNSLIKKIGEKKQLLLDWNNILPIYNRKVVDDYQVLEVNYDALRLELALLFDAAYENKQFKKREKDKLAFLVEEIVSSLITSESDADIKALYNKYSQSDFDTDQQEAEARTAELMRSMAQSIFDLDLPEDLDLSSPEKVEAAMAEKLLEHEQLAKERQSKKKKTAKQLAKESRLKEEAQNISKSIQEVYRKLVRNLHPDREQDPTERERKTEIMQRVNIAYDKKDLLKLLELQLEIEQIDQTQLNNISAERLKYFNQILKEQLDDINLEIAQVEMPFKARLALSPFASLSPKLLIIYLDADIKDLKKNVRALKQDLAAFNNVSSLKEFLITFKIPKRTQRDFLDDFDTSFY